MPERNVPLATAEALARALRREVARLGLRSRVVGSVRRGASRVGDVDILVVGEPVGEVLGRVVERLRDNGRGRPALVGSTGGDRRRRATVRWRGRLYAVDFFAATPDELPWAMFHLTGSHDYNVRVRAHAKRKGWRLNQYGLFLPSGRRVPGSAAARTERDVARLLGVSYRPPSDRER